MVHKNEKLHKIHWFLMFYLRHILLQFSLLNTSKYYFKLFYHRLLDIRKEILHIFFSIHT